MAASSQGFSVSWDGSALTEVYSVTWQKGGGLPTSRDGTWSDSLGSFSVEAFAAIGATYGQRASFSVGGLTGFAVCTGVGGSVQVNDARRYSATFQIVS
jgi:hypothetical protein